MSEVPTAGGSEAEVWVVRAGMAAYEEARQAQKRLEEARHGGEIPDVLVLLEHAPVYTRGRRSSAEELPMGEDWYRMQGIEVCDTDRGGRVTYHGPGQLVAYPIVDLRAQGGDIHRYIRRLEQTMVESLAAWGLKASPIEGLTGVWTNPPEAAADAQEAVLSGSSRKIGSIGVHVNRGITTHGLAVNVNNDLQPFEWIVPCGIEGCRMTSLCRELGEEQDLDAFASTLCETFARVYGRRTSAVSATDLAAQVAGVSALAAGASAPVAGETATLAFG